MPRLSYAKFFCFVFYTETTVASRYCTSLSQELLLVQKSKGPILYSLTVNHLTGVQHNKGKPYQFG